MRKILAIAFAWLLAIGQVHGQGVGNMPAWNIGGNPSASAAPMASAAITQMLDGAFCGTNGAVLVRGASVWACVTGGVPNSNLANMNADTFKGNATGSAAAPADLTVPQAQALLNLNVHPQGRLTLQSATPVMTSTQSAQTAVYYAPYIGAMVPIYNGTQLGIYQFTSSVSDNVGLTLTLGSNWAANAAYDVFVTLGGGTTPELCTVAWTNTTTRATTLAIYNGLLTNSASATCRTTNSATITLGANQGTYLGSFYTNGSTGTVDYIYGAAASGGTAASFGLYNYYNRVTVTTSVIDNGTGYTYGIATVRQARASAGNQVKFMVGVVEDGVPASVNVQATTAATATTTGNWGIGCNATNAFTGQPAQIYAVSATANSLAMPATAVCQPTLGVYTVSSNEEGDGAHNVTFDNSSLDTLTVQVRM